METFFEVLLVLERRIWIRTWLAGGNGVRGGIVLCEHAVAVLVDDEDGVDGEEREVAGHDCDFLFDGVSRYQCP